jgi:hypothetical protein
VRQAALTEVQKEIQERAGSVIHDALNQSASSENLKSHVRIWEFCIDMLSDNQLSRDGTLQKIFGEADGSRKGLPLSTT